ncbi:MAG TPA: lysylphosphatidylglycerol synthase transmembrane domain-containing protein [Usitatibacter sp.]|nr:lysylphosphatidylglycerol synthase transmembrane domain-containing protein [Usitatibacter sp.]
MSLAPDIEKEESPLAAATGGGFRHNARKAATFFLKYVVGVSLIAWMVASGKLELASLTTLPRTLVAECLGLIAVQTVLAALRVRYILRQQGIETGLVQCVMYNCSGVLYSAFLPGGISGDAVRAYLFMKAVPGQRLGILGAMVLDRLLGLVTMVALGLVAALYLALTLAFIRPYLLAFTAIFAALTGGLALLHFIGGRHRPGERAASGLRSLWAKLHGAIAELRIHHYSAGTIASVMAQSFLIHLTTVGVIYLCSLHAGAALGFLEVFTVTPIGLLVNAVPLSPGGLGIGENAFELLYRAIQGRQGATSFLISRIFLYAPALVGLAYIAQRLVFRRRRGAPAATDSTTKRDNS